MKADYKIQLKQEPGVSIQPHMFGLFFEDINYAADGGLYAEMIENRSFECQYYDEKSDTITDGFLFSWNLNEEAADLATMTVCDAEPLNENNTHYMTFTSKDETGKAGFYNQAYEGIACKAGESYDFSMYAKGRYGATIRVTVEKDGVVYAETSFDGVQAEWNKYEAVMTAKEDVRHAHLVIRLMKPGTVDFDVISLFPQNTYNNRKNGLRADLVEKLKGIKPGFLRFPGGCIIEGVTLSNRYNWKESVGDVAERKQNYNRWQTHTEINKDYCQTYGLGYYEYFLLCEDIGAKPLPVVNCTIACQYQSGECLDMDSEAFEEYIQDALDLVEFANGDTSTKWGSLRARMGHPEPFHLEYVGIGNEQWETDTNHFHERYERFQKAFAKQYPEIRLVGTAGPDPSGPKFDRAWDYLHAKAKELGTPEAIEQFASVIDEHYYKNPDWFFENDGRYDSYDRNGFKVFAGEYASHDLDHEKKNTWRAALSEAAFMTGLERNADVVFMASYAPLFARQNYVQWTPDMIWFNDVESFGTPSYYVQKLYGNHTGSVTVPCEIEVLCNVPEKKEIYTTTSYDEAAQELIVKVVNAADSERTVELSLHPYHVLSDTAMSYTIQSDDLDDVNSFEEPEKIQIVEKAVDGIKETFTYIMPKYCVTAFRIKASR